MTRRSARHSLPTSSTTIKDAPQCELADHFEALSVSPKDSPKLRRSARVSSRGSSIYGTPARTPKISKRPSRACSLRSTPVKNRLPQRKHKVKKISKPRKKDDNVNDDDDDVCWTKLKVSRKVPSGAINALPGREQEFELIKEKILDSVKTKQGYISGVPGTGKTATVRQAIRTIQANPKCPQFEYVEINGMKISDVNQAYSLLLGQLTGRTLSGVASLRRLTKMFGNSRHRPIVVLLDELDLLLKKKASILYHFFEWTGWSTAKLIVIAIANTMDLPERFMPNRIASRMGSNRINFKPYTYPQLMAIIDHRQAEWRHIFHPDALEYCARKVSAVSGDARRALSLAKRAVDWVLGNPSILGPQKLITIPLMERAIQMTFSGNTVQVMSDLSTRQKILLLSILLANRTTGSTSVNFEAACENYWQILRSNSLPSLPFSSLQLAFAQLEQLRLACRLQADLRSPVVASTMIKLCVPEEEICLALKQVSLLQKHL